jgi:hypothetical protein
MSALTEIVRCACGVQGAWREICDTSMRGCGTCHRAWPEYLVERAVSAAPAPTPDPAPLLGDTLRKSAAFAERAAAKLSCCTVGEPSTHTMGYAQAALEGLALIMSSEAGTMDALEPRPSSNVPAIPQDLDAEAERFGHTEDEDEGRCELCGMPVELWGASDVVTVLCPSRLLEEVQTLRERQAVPRLRRSLAVVAEEE